MDTNYINPKDEEWRVSKDGFSIKSGWGYDEVTITKTNVTPTQGFVDSAYSVWLDLAEKLCATHNDTLAKLQASTMTTTLRFHKDNTLPTEGEVFVFGSNLAGIHGKGAALVARQYYGAKLGCGVGYMKEIDYHTHPTYKKHCYAIPTKDRTTDCCRHLMS